MSKTNGDGDMHGFDAFVEEDILYVNVIEYFIGYKLYPVCCWYKCCLIYSQEVHRVLYKGMG